VTQFDRNIAPVIFLNFNRPEKTKISLAAIKKARPSSIFVFADGPRDNNKEDIYKCKVVRDLIEQEINWSCKLYKFFPENNMGCGIGVATAISTAFNYFDHAMIIEDDVVPDSSFFDFASALLEEHFDSNVVGAINGSHLSTVDFGKQRGYYHSRYFYSWGWATWRRVWEKYDFFMRSWPIFKDSADWKESLMSDYEFSYWNSIFNRQGSDLRSDTWDYQFTYTLWSNKLLTLAPTINLVENIGFDEEATHTKSRNTPKVERSSFVGEKVELIDSSDRLLDQLSFWEVFGKKLLPEADSLIPLLKIICERKLSDEERLRACSKLKAIARLPGLDALRGHIFHTLGKQLDAIQAYREELRWFPRNVAARSALAELDRVPDVSQFGDAIFSDLFTIVYPHTMLSKERLFALYVAARRICESQGEGCLFDCGVAGGGSTLLLGLISQRFSNGSRLVFAFDTFEGMPPSSIADIDSLGQRADDGHWGLGTCSASLEHVQSLLNKYEICTHVKLHKGLFAETLPLVRERVKSISLLHMDGDWYESTLDILNNLFDCLEDKAYVQIDDYGHWDGCRKAMDVFCKQRSINLDINSIDGVGHYFFHSNSNKGIQNPGFLPNLLVNVGCGASYHPAWKNFDIRPVNNEQISKFDIRSGIPLPDKSSKFVYSSHFLEHLTRGEAIDFLGECNRILSDSGLIRIVIPDLQRTIEEYVVCLNGALDGDHLLQQRYEWVIHELIDQLVRHSPGGDMLSFVSSLDKDLREYVANRVGDWALRVPAGIPAPSKPSDSIAIGDFRLSGEAHLWMYDRYSISLLLRKTGFEDIRFFDSFNSQLDGFNDFHLDSSDGVRPRKPDSLYIEARKSPHRDILNSYSIQVRTTELKPACFSTVATKAATRDVQALLASMSLKMPGSKIIIFSDTYVSKNALDMPFPVNLDLEWQICLDQFSDFNRTQLEAMGKWAELQEIKPRSMLFALETGHNDVMFLDADIFILSPITLKNWSGQLVSLSPHFIIKEIENRHGKYNGGVIWAKDTAPIDYWISRFPHSRYYDQACLEDVFNKFDCHVMGEHQNISPFRIFNAPENPILTTKRFAPDGGGLTYKGEKVEFIHTHIAQVRPPIFNLFNQLISEQLSKNSDKTLSDIFNFFRSQ
jgi:hypothetical protein